MSLLQSISLTLLALAAYISAESETCLWLDDSGACHDPSLQSFSVDLGHGTNETFWAYVVPDVATFHNETPGSRKVKRPHFAGQLGKWINLSPERTRLSWDAGNDRDLVYIADMDPFEASATATFPGHRFVLTPARDQDKILARWTVKRGESILVYDPFKDKQDATKSLTPAQMKKYMLQKENLMFAEQYRKVTGRQWVALYPYQQPPMHFMWSADFFGQTHVFETKETHFTAFPPADEVKPYTSSKSKSLGGRQLQEYRSLEETQSFTLTVLSCAPRVFEIKNFLSDVEVDHIMELATGMKLSMSTTRASSDGEARTDAATRTSRNSWVAREKSPIIDSIYRRAADLLRIDEALLRKRSKDEFPYIPSTASIAETLQLVHYDVGQQYTPHHDFSIPSASVQDQPMRFSTILLYLNDGMKGGETAFPRWMNSESSDSLKVVPEKGKAVLFYSLLPDGNMDDLSQHSAMPVKTGEKWLTNLWVWDPYSFKEYFSSKEV